MELDQDVDSHSQSRQMQKDVCTIWKDDDVSQASPATNSVYTPSHASNEEPTSRLGVMTSDVVDIIYEALKIKIFLSAGSNSDIHVCKDSAASCLTNLFPSIWRPGFLKVRCDI